MKRLKKGCYNRLAAAHDLTRSSISKWPQERRSRELALLDAGATPAIANRLAELQKLCYQASVLTKNPVTLHSHSIERVKELIDEVFAVDLLFETCAEA